MAEGHAVARWADALRPLVGEVVIDVRAPLRWRERAEALRGTRITDVATHGKHLVLHFEADWVIHTHAMQYGSWQIGAPGEPPRKPERFIRLRLTTVRHEALFFHGPVMEVLRREEFAAHTRFHSLGPDLLKADFSVGAVRRALRRDAREIGDVLLDQRVVAGIGNIYKSEGLFLAGIHPRRSAHRVTRAELRTLFAELIPLMQTARLVTGATVTLPEELQFDGSRNWVYRRRGRPCFVCATPIDMLRQGEFGRATYFCRICQAV